MMLQATQICRVLLACSDLLRIDLLPMVSEMASRHLPATVFRLDGRGS
jgi:hypothetical protein